MAADPVALHDRARLFFKPFGVSAFLKHQNGQRFAEMACQVFMTKYFSLIFSITSLFTECSKTKVDYVSGDLIISKAEAPSITTLAEGIIASVRCWRPNSCYQFSHFEVREEAPLQYDIFAKANLPKREGICLEVFAGADPSLIIRPAVKGEYILRFHNVESSTAFIIDTVQVN